MKKTLRAACLQTKIFKGNFPQCLELTINTLVLPKISSDFWLIYSKALCNIFHINLLIHIKLEIKKWDLSWFY